MNAVTPSLSAVLSLQPQQNQLNARPDLKLDDKSTAQATTGGNSTVTLSENAATLTQENLNLNANQLVKQAQAVESLSIDSNQTTLNPTYSSNLQNNRAFYAK